MSALRGFRIVELAEGVSGEYCGKLLADFAAEIIKVERPGTGSPTRAMAPVVDRGESVETSGLFAYLNTNKKSVALDLTQASDLERLHELIATADVVIDDHDDAWMAERGLGAAVRDARHPSVIFCSITPFGLNAPAGWATAKSLNVFHTGGWGYHTPTAADPERPPLKGAGRFTSDYEAAIDAALCIASTLYWRNRTGMGQSIDISAREVLLSRADTVFGRMLAGEVEVSSARTAYDMGGPASAFPCANGFVYLMILHSGHWAALKKLMDHPEWMNAFADNWLEFACTDEAVATFRAGFSAWVRPHEKDQVSEDAQRLGIPLVPVNDASDLHRSPQFQHRRFFQELEHPVLGRALYPTTPYKLSASPAKLVTPAPQLGEHAAEVLGETAAAPRDRVAHAGRAGARVTKTSRGGPLEGVRILEITKVWAGPYAGKLLAYLGAEVIKVESNSNPDEMRAYGGADPDNAPYFLSLNPEILSVQVNMKSEEGMKHLREMIAKSDVVLNNIRPGAMERSGLGYEDLRKIKPDIISVSVKMYGNEGPLGYQTGYAPCFAALGGLNYLVGYEGEPPTGSNIRYGDSTVGALAAFAAIVAVMHRERTGEGQFVDVSAVEAMSSMVGDSLFAYSLTGQSPRADGNRHADMAPHGCYRCAGEDWLSLAVGSEAEWRALCAVLGDVDLAGDARFDTLARRQANLAALDARLAQLTRPQDAAGLAERLRAAGVGAFKSLNSLDLVADAELWRREFFRLVSDHKNDSRPVLGAPWRMSRAQASITNGAPKLGEHNAYVYGEILGMPRDKLDQLIAAKVVD